MARKLPVLAWGLAMVVALAPVALPGAGAQTQTAAGLVLKVSPDEASMTHSLHTVVIDRRGNLEANLEGNEFTAKQLCDFVEIVLNRAPAYVPRAKL
ncbi:MAG: hypothetical protein ACLQVG_08915 [Terriglobia bacterium]